MKKIMLTILGLLATISSFAQADIEVTVKNIQANKGSIRIGLFTNEENFLKKPVEGKIVKVSGSEAKVVFEGLQEGEYAVSVIHDENDNGELDKNAFGMPKEGFAFGNNAMGMFGPPSFDKAKVKVGSTKVTQVIELKYL